MVGQVEPLLSSPVAAEHTCGVDSVDESAWPSRGGVPLCNDWVGDPFVGAFFNVVDMLGVDTCECAVVRALDALASTE